VRTELALAALPARPRSVTPNPPATARFAFALAVLLTADLAHGQHATGDAELPRTPFHVVHALQRTPPFFDATPTCIPDELAGGLEVRVRLRDGDLPAVRRVLSELAKQNAPSLPALRAIVATRTSSATQRGEARRALLRYAEQAETPAIAACLLLEGARLALLRGQPLEARRDRLAALRSVGEWPAQHAPIAAWLEAEESHRSGDESTARARWQLLSEGGDARLALAARLRLVEAQAPVGGPPANVSAAAELWKMFPKLLESAANARLDIEPWSLVAAEIAIAAGDLGSAHYWLARAELAWRGGLASVRKADVLAALGRASDARNTLGRVSRAAKDERVRQLAELRLAQLDLAAGLAEKARARCEEPASSLHPAVRAEALLLLARTELALGHAAPALALYARIAYGGGDADASAEFSHGFRAAVDLLTAPRSDCASVLQHLASRASLLERYSESAKPLLRVGDCSLELAMPGAALDIYRTAARRFGDADGVLRLRIATAALAAGDLAETRSALEAQRVSPSRETGDAGALRWEWLEFQLAEREGLAPSRLPQLAALARAAELPEDLRTPVELALLRWMKQGMQSADARTALASSLAQEPELASDPRGYAWLRAADLALSERDAEAAARAYARAASLLDSGAARDRALHHAALLAGSREARRAPLLEASASEPATAWSRMAAIELRLERLADQVDQQRATAP
jgi:hypothetical protein